MKNLYPYIGLHTPDEAHINAKEARLRQEYLQKIVAGELPEGAPFEFDRVAEEQRLIVDFTVIRDDGSRQQETYDVADLITPDDAKSFGDLYRLLLAAASK